MIFGLVLNTKKEIAIEVAKRIIEFLFQRGYEVLIEKRDDEPCIEDFKDFFVSDDIFLKKVDLIIVLGGDGTFLRASRKAVFYDIPILGVDLGGLGFLSEIGKEQIEEGIERFVKGNYSIEERMMIEASIFEKDELIFSSVALNDVVLNKFRISRITKFVTKVNGKDLTTYPADGIIISTPTGSTAYSLSAGGPIVEPLADVLVVTPICAHTLYSRSLVIRGDREIEITLFEPEEDVLVTYDGQKSLKISYRNKIIIKKYKKKVKIVRFYGAHFFDVLREKLRWG